MESLNSNSKEKELQHMHHESSFDSETKDVHAIKHKMSKAKVRCMTYFRSLHSHLQVLSNEDLKGTCTDDGFERAFISLFGQDVQTFTSTMFLYVDQLKKQLDKDEFQKDGSMAAFWVLNRQSQQFIYSQFSLDYDNQMTNKSFSEYTRIEAKNFIDTLLKHMSYVKKSIAERACYQRQYDRRVNKTQMQMQEGEVNRGKALDADLVVTESSGSELEKHDTSCRFENDKHAEDADIKPVNDKEPMDEVQMTAEYHVLANEHQHTRQSEPTYYTYLLEKVDSNTTPDSTNMSNMGGEIDQNAKKCQVTSPLLNPSPDNMTTEFANQSLKSENIFLKKTVA
ncbi:hypothetical protein Tco_1046903 [Tanacetum coccineum]